MDRKTAAESNVKAPERALGEEADRVRGRLPRGGRRTRGRLRSLVIPFLAIVTALIIGALVIVFTDETVYAAFGDGVGRGVARASSVITRAYGAFFSGALGNPVRIITALFSGQGTQIRRAIYPLTETIRISTPYIFAGLAVALGFQGGLFNIGAEGQYFVAGLVTVFVGYAVTGLPGIIHLPLALLAGAVGGESGERSRGCSRQRPARTRSSTRS